MTNKGSKKCGAHEKGGQGKKATDKRGEKIKKKI